MPTEFVFVTADMADAYWSEWRAIDRRYPALSEAPEGMDPGEHWGNLNSLRRSAREDLRRSLRQVAELGHSGLYPIPV